ncbi:hypothetical protein PVAND_001546 [Polypedilum vanderplanki]|uniref:Uncharacterized protein n=1 Tax=Polypedilum vanderplanki TaxID=319348 RepID=A0A9J6BNR0_POLVA|nr:hypothetical protein PVAND_001546 [Polypedilum vanderplanki]
MSKSKTNDEVHENKTKTDLKKHKKTEKTHTGGILSWISEKTKGKKKEFDDEKDTFGHKEKGNSSKEETKNDYNMLDKLDLANIMAGTGK